MIPAALLIAIPFAQAAASRAYQYTKPFIQPAPIWDYWPLTLLPLCLIIAVVYKSIRCDSMSRVPREALILFAFIIGVMVLSALALAGLVHAIER